MHPVTNEHSDQKTEPKPAKISADLAYIESRLADEHQAILRRAHKDLKERHYQLGEQCKLLHEALDWSRFKFRLACAAVAFLTIMCAAVIYSRGHI